jgi:hypothetical protein
MRRARCRGAGSSLPCLSFPKFTGMTGFGLSESDKNSGNGYKSFIELFHAKGLDFKKGFSEVEIVSE